MKNTNKLMPENDLQELWELNGRVYAAKEYLKNEGYINKETLYAMLGGDIEELREGKHDED